MPRPLKYPHRMEIYFGDVEFELLKCTASMLGATPAEYVRAALVDNLEKGRIGTNLWAAELIKEAKNQCE